MARTCLIHFRLSNTKSDNPLQLALIEVADADALRKPSRLDANHFAPDLLDGALALEMLGRYVYKEQVDPLDPQLSKTLLQGLLDGLSTFELSEFRRNVEILALKIEPLRAERILDSLADVLLVLIHLGCVEVPEAHVQGHLACVGAVLLVEGRSGAIGNPGS